MGNPTWKKSSKKRGAHFRKSSSGTDSRMLHSDWSNNAKNSKFFDFVNFTIFVNRNYAVYGFGNGHNRVQWSYFS